MENKLWLKEKLFKNDFKAVVNALLIQWPTLLVEYANNIGDKIKQKCWKVCEEKNRLQEIDAIEGMFYEPKDDMTYVPAFPEDIYGVMF